MKKSIKKMLIVTILTIVCTFNMVGCALFKSEVNELNGEISGNTYNASFYSNDGEKFMDIIFLAKKVGVVYRTNNYGKTSNFS